MTATKNHFVYPRMSRFKAEQRWQELKGLTHQELAKRIAIEPHGHSWCATGERVSVDRLKEIRNQLVKHAVEFGYPEKITSKEKFDFKSARTLYESMEIIPGEANRSEVWNFIGLCMLPDLSRWRFPTGEIERFVGNAGQRNTFQRLWWRAHTLYDETAGYDLMNLKEDRLVQIMERPAISSNPGLARSIARIIRNKNQFASGVGEELFSRQFIKLVRQRGSHIDYAALDTEQRDKQLAKMAESLASHLRVSETSQ